MKGIAGAIKSRKTPKRLKEGLKRKYEDELRQKGLL